MGHHRHVQPGADDYEYRGAPPPELRGEPEPPPAPRDAHAAARRTARRRRRRVWAWLAVLFLLPFSVPLVFRGLDLDGPSPVPQMLAFLPWFLAPAWLGLVAAVLARRVLPVVWAVAVLVATGWFLQPYGPDAPAGAADPPGNRFRVLTANLHHGDALPALRELLRDERPQLVAVQECGPACAAALRADEVRDLYPHRVIVEGGSAEGSALLSAYPLRSTPPVPGMLAMPGAVVDVGDRSLRFQLAHPMPPLLETIGPWERELGRLADFADERAGEPLVMAGDFNATQDHAAFRAVLDAGLGDVARLEGRSRTPTWPTQTAPPLGAQIDHVLVSDDFDTHGVTFFDLPGSDHRAVLADIALR
ncbi:endonuclease/exonuclease/phosphatase family protein [Streptomyces sp. RKND-216]|nr:endonuclease/exonuclease/phosphatase family protein [Streptomyces sp. RKND-216]